MISKSNELAENERYTSENNDLIGLMRNHNRAARTARILVEFIDVVCQMATSFKVLTTM